MSESGCRNEDLQKALNEVTAAKNRLTGEKTSYADSVSVITRDTRYYISPPISANIDSED